jgi:hypothetical protein
MTVSEQHSAGPSFAGFAFQLDRAIQWLAEAKLGDQVGIESLDDVVLQSKDGSLHIEQDKLSFVRNPVTDHSANLWKTLGIWIELIESGECEVTNCQFYLVTNQPVKSGIAAMLCEAPENRDNKALVRTVRKVAKTQAPSVSRHATLVQALSDGELRSLLDRVHVVDKAPFANPDGANAHLGDCLSLSPQIVDPVVSGIRGWILELATMHFTSQARADATASSQIGWIDVGQFREVKNRLITKYFDNRLIVRAAKEIVVTEEQAESARSEKFVRQLELIEFDSDHPEDFIEAITDFLRSKEERTRLAVENGITSAVFGSYENNLIDHWKITKRQITRRNAGSESAAGQELLDECLKHQPQLDGHMLSEGYLPRGTFHYLANVPIVGWHPRYPELL